MKKKIVFFVESLHCGGAERSLLSLLKNLNPSRYDIQVLVLNKGGEFEEFLPSFVTYKKVDIKFGFLGRLKFKLFQKLLPKRHNAQFFWKAFNSSIPQYLEEFDVAVGWGQGFATYFIAEKIKAKRKLAWVNTDYAKAGYKSQYDQEIYSKYDKVVGISDFVKNSMEAFIPADKVITIPNIIDVDDVEERAQETIKENLKKSDKMIIVSVGRLAKPKAFDLAIKAANVLKNKGVDFIWYIIGEGGKRDYLQSLINEYELNEHLTLLGFRSNPYPYIKQADLYVQTSIFEGLGRTLIEATMLHKPIVTTDFETAFDLVDQRKTGMITSKNPEDIAAAIFEIYENEDLYQEMKKNQAFSSRISATHVVEQFDDMVEELLKE